jgi:hypothetical protein
VLIQFSTKTTKVLYTEKVKGNEVSTYNVKVMQRHVDTSQFAFCDNDSKREIEIEGIVAKLLRPNFFGGTAFTLTLKYCDINFLRKKFCRPRKSVLYGH